MAPSRTAQSAGTAPAGAPARRLRAWAGLALLVTLSACGGADEPDRMVGEDTGLRSAVGGSDEGGEPTAEALARLALIEQVAQTVVDARLRAQPAFTDPATGMAWDWVLSLPTGGAVDAVSLEPQRGRGYPEPLLRLVPREAHTGAGSARDSPRPDCRSDTRCEFSGPGRFAVTLPAASPLRAVPRGDAVALVARVLAVDQPVEVTLRLQAQGRPDQFREIILQP